MMATAASTSASPMISGGRMRITLSAAGTVKSPSARKPAISSPAGARALSPSISPTPRTSS